jgi:hypothetical protein
LPTYLFLLIKWQFPNMFSFCLQTFKSFSFLYRTQLLLVMRDLILRFPYVAEQIFQQLNNEDLAKSREVERLWQKFIDERNYQSVSCEKKSHTHTCAHTSTCAMCVQKAFLNVRAMCVRAALLSGVRCAIAHLHIFAHFLYTFFDI